MKKDQTDRDLMVAFIISVIGCPLFLFVAMGTIGAAAVIATGISMVLLLFAVFIAGVMVALA